ncbi:MAG: Verru_Chthon cassette protein A, partial [Verrucomicrobiales bacterium]|nr:Verru_Chthon cassette protein A [Verrucomicrobiales bacterium]
DQDRLYASVDELVFRMASSGGNRMRNSLFGGASSIPVEKIERARGLLTTHSRAPELNVFGRPRMALWPLHQNETARGNQYRSAFDNAISFAATLGARTRGNVSNQMKFYLQRENSQSRTWEFYRHGKGNNRRLYQYIMDQTHQVVPGYGKSLAQKYGASESPTFDYRRASRATRDTDLESDAFRDHAKVGAMIFDYLRGTNLYDANVREPYADLDPDGDNFTPFGQTTCFILHDTNLLNGDGGNDDTRWPDFKPKPKGMGRLYTLSEVALVIFCSADGRLTREGTPGAGELPYQRARPAPRFSGLRGNSADRRELAQHPMAFDPNLVGQTLRYLQIGVVFELFSPMQGFHQIHPLTTLRMVTGGEGYKGAFGIYDGSDASPTTNNVNLKNGYTKHTGYKIVSQSGFQNPITYWGSQNGNVPARSNPEYNGGNPIGPVLQTIPVGETNINRIKGELPKSWFGWGGYGGYRILRFADINIRPGREVHQDGGEELTNGSNTLGGIYAQKGIVVNTPRSNNSGEPSMRLLASKDSKGGLIPMQFLIYDADSGGLSNGNVIQTFEVAFPDGILPVPQLAHSGSWEGWGRRFGRAGRDEAADGRVDVITRNDVVRSMIPVHGDYRHIAAKRFVPQTMWAPHPFYSDTGEIKAHSLTWSNPAGAEEVRSTAFRSTLGPLGCALLDDVNAKRGGETRSLINDDTANQKYSARGSKARRFRADFTFDPDDEDTFAPGIDHENCIIAFDPDLTRDFDNGVGSSRDGAFTNKADDGADTQDPRVRYPYFEVTTADRFDYRDRTSIDNTYSPNQMIPSPVVFGSLPSLVDANIPWNTLLFRPNMLPTNGINPKTGDRVLRFGARGVGVEIDYEIEPVTVLDNPASRRNEGRDRHQGIISTQTRSVEDEQLPPEHLWLDLFWMPTVQPYPLSEPFSTAGKVNLNYQMMPFNYIERATALHALLKSERMLAIPTDMVDEYKDGSDDDRQVTFHDDGADPWYKKIDADNTLLQFREKFDKGEAFITESEICEMFLYPKTRETTEYDENGENIRRFWDNHKLTGDNTLERPYGNLYPRLTTKSNVYTVHMTVQVLKKARSSKPDGWEEGKDQVVGTYRGSSTIERYIDPNRSLGRAEDAMPLYINARNTRDSKDSIQKGLESYYEYRIVNQKHFAH